MRSRTRSRLTITVVALGLVAAACGGAARSDATPRAAADVPGNPPTVTTEPRTGPPVPTTTFETFDGERTSLAAYAGQPIVLNFWASWCPSCVAEMSAAFKPVQADLGDEVLFVGMNIQDDRDLALALLEETGVEWLSAEDPRGELYVELGGLGMPFTVYVSADGEVIDSHNGPLTESQLREQIRENLLG
jgi:thiol-disulfide isomerase/thioredoxin